MLAPPALFLHMWCSSLLSNVYTPRLLLDLSCAPCCPLQVGTIRASVREEALLAGMAPKASLLVLVCRQIGALHGKKTSNPVR